MTGSIVGLFNDVTQLVFYKPMIIYIVTISASSAIALLRRLDSDASSIGNFLYAQIAYAIGQMVTSSLKNKFLA